MSAQFENNGGVAVGSYAGVNAAPGNGLIVPGYVGIGVATPTQPLHVNGTIRSDQVTINQNGNLHNGAIEITYNDLSTYGIVLMDTNTGTPNAPALQFERSGNIVGTIEIDNSGTTYNTMSDRRLKENIVDTDIGLSSLMRVKVRNYTYKNGNTAQQGFIAQELNEVYPFAVSAGKDDIKEKAWGIDYGRLTPLLTKAIQELKTENDELKARLDAQEKEINAIKEQMKSR